MENEYRKNIKIAVESQYLSDESDPAKARYLFQYTITIRNESDVAARLLRRHWKITAGNGSEQKVTGDAVVGEYPYLKPTETFTYTSAAMLDTPVGMMEGDYDMIDDAGIRFAVSVPAFSLSVPKALH